MKRANEAGEHAMNEVEVVHGLLCSAFSMRHTHNAVNIGEKRIINSLRKRMMKDIKKRNSHLLLLELGLKEASKGAHGARYSKNNNMVSRAGFARRRTLNGKLNMSTGRNGRHPKPLERAALWIDFKWLSRSRKVRHCCRLNGVFKIVGFRQFEVKPAQRKGLENACIADIFPYKTIKRMKMGQKYLAQCRA